MNIKLRDTRLILIIVFLSSTLFACGGSGSDNNSPPLANAGSDQALVVGSVVSLDGNRSIDADGDSLSYTWSFISRPFSSSATLSDPRSVTPSFVADVVGDYVLSLVVNDGGLNSDPDIVTISILKQNSAPLAKAGSDQALIVGSVVSLDGNRSIDTDGDSLSYTWSFISKPFSSSAILSDPRSATPSFVADVIGDYVLSLVVNDGGLDSAADEVVVTVATGVGGIIYNDTNWILANSPYLITSDVQIAYGATLQIDANVKIIGNNRDIKVFGILDVKGLDTAKVKFNDVNIVPGSGPTNEWFKINIDHAEVNSGSVYYPSGGAIYGSISLRNSILKNIKYMYLWYPVEDSLIEKNIFIDSGGISIGHRGDVKVYVRNNVFYQYTGDNGQVYAIKNWANYGSSESIIEYNSFLNTDRIALILPSRYNPTGMTVINNYWNTTDTEKIEAMIYDKNDDLSSFDYLMYSPFLTEPDSNTPDITSYVP